ncbi:MAG: tetratricopeptide repeat protein, partial [Alphaproteobacteria bacterium]|nr:tetratricopeptide repeat protein [Alphaproteobacteria bacterium]
RESGELTQAADSFRRAAAVKPGYVEPLLNLSVALGELGRLEEAEAVARRVQALAPTTVEGYFQRAAILQRQGRLDESIADYRRGLELRPDDAPSLLNLGNCLQTQGKSDEAVAVLEQALARSPDSFEIYNNIGNARLSQGRRNEAIACYRRALAVKPTYTLALNNLGVALQEGGQLEEAMAAYRLALGTASDADACNNLGLVLTIYGDYGQARSLFKQAVDLRPGFTTAYRHLMTTMLYDPSLDAGARWELARGFEATYAAPIAARPVAPYVNRREPEKRLKVGYVSSDLYEHPVGRNLEPVVAHRDRERFEVVCYADVARPDGLTARFQGSVDQWRWTTGRTDEQVAAQVRADEVDVLVVLAARFDRNRPLVAAYRPAPVRVSFHDPGTSGLSAMEYLIADRVLVPRNTPERFSERVVALPSFYIHGTLAGPEVGPLPADGRGHVTFGSFNNPAKVNDQVLAMWGEVLRAVPGSRLKLKCKNWFVNSSLKQRFLGALGVAAEQVEFDTVDRALGDHLGLYNDVDVALDPFPFTGSTTTFEALWMGVPVVTLAGAAMAGRWSASILHALKLDELVAGSGEEYVPIAAGLAGDRARLAGLRAELRGRVAASPLCNGKARARQVERIYRALWRRWCRGE